MEGTYEAAELTSAKFFRNRKATFVTSLPCTTTDDKEKPWITGCTFLADDRLVLADRNNKKVKVYSSDLAFNNEFVLESAPWDVAAYDKDRIAITLRDKREIRLLSVEQEITSLQTIPLTFTCNGISSLSSERLIVIAKPNFVVVVDIHGKQITRLNFGKGYLFTPFNIVLNASKSIAYVSSYANDKICALDVISNKVLFYYRHDDMRKPRGMTVDLEGNVYVCCSNTHNVHQISSEGELIQILLSRNDKLYGPTAVCFSNDGQRLLVTDENDDPDKRVKIFNMI